jgi:hypothetical protein
MKGYTIRIYARHNLDVTVRAPILRTRFSVARRGSVPILAAVLLSALMAVPAGLTASIAPTSTGARSFSEPTITGVATASLGPALGTHDAAPFWAVMFPDYGLGPRETTALGQYFNSTPFTWYRLGEGGAGYDPTTETNWVAPVSGTAYTPVHEEMINLTWFKAWCYSRTPHCDWISALPAEQNNTQFALHVAQYYHNVLHFVPNLWEFGNEPNAWTHYGINISKWSTNDASTPTGIGYATMVKNYIAAISKVYPSDRYIGIESNCACGTSLIPTTMEIDGPKLAAMAYHNYPWITNSSVQDSQFMGSLYSPTRNLTYTADRMRTLDTSLCPSCGNIPVQVGEYNAGPVPDHSPFAMNYSGAPFMAASVVEALEANVSMFTVYDLAWLYNSSTATILPEGMLYQRILSNMTMGKDTVVNVKVSNVGGIFAVLVKNGTRESLLVVNTNVSRAISLSLTTSVFPVGALGSTYSWDPRSLSPVATKGITLGTSFTIWSRGILLINNF